MEGKKITKKQHTPLFAAGLLIVAGLTVLCSGCSSLVNLGGRALDGSAFNEKTLARYRSLEKEDAAGFELREVLAKGGGFYFTLSPNLMPSLVFVGSVPEAGSFRLDSLRFFASDLMGWNEFTRELSGGGLLRVEEGRAVLRLEGPVDPLDITEGKIRQKDTRLMGEQALQALRNREDRIAALSQWMRSQEGLPAFNDKRAFEKYWKPILFPELVSRKKRPETWSETGVLWAWAEDVRWNLSYTEKLFSGELQGELRRVRDSGTLLRDWEEAASWIYLEYEWDTIIGLLGEEIEFTKIK
jgi:hypothetical protein